MPYYFDSYDAPSSGAQDLSFFLEIWNEMKNDLLDVVFETKEDAVAQKYRKHDDPSGIRFGDWSLVRYRKTDDREMLLHFHDLGLEALAYTEAAIKSGRLDTNFLYYWGMLSACHGYVLCASLAQGNDLLGERAGAASREATSLGNHRKWFAHVFFRPELEGLTRDQKTEKIEKLVAAIIDPGGADYSGQDAEWFKKFLNLNTPAEENDYYGQVTFAFRDRKLTQKHMLKLAGEAVDDIPSVNLLFPTP